MTGEVCEVDGWGAGGVDEKTFEVLHLNSIWIWMWMSGVYSRERDDARGTKMSTSSFLRDSRF